MNDLHKNPRPESPKLLQKEVIGWKQNIQDREEEERGPESWDVEPAEGQSQPGTLRAADQLRTVPSLTASAIAWVTDSGFPQRRRQGTGINSSVGPSVTTRVTLTMLTPMGPFKVLTRKIRRRRTTVGQKQMNKERAAEITRLQTEGALCSVKTQTSRVGFDS